MNKAVMESLLTRRSVLARDMIGPGPSLEERDQILAAAHRVPDHGKIGPWRFVIFEGESREAFGESLAEIFAADNSDASEKLVTFERERLTRAPLVIAVISSPVEHKVPQWEQLLSSGAACQNILLAAQSLGFGAQWLTEWYAYHEKVDGLLGLTDGEKVAGFIYIGSFQDKPKERVRPDLGERVSFWGQG